MITIYHNPRCSKSREGINFLENLNLEFETIKYIDESISKEELKSILKKLNYKAIELIRTKEKIWIENYKNMQLSENEIIDIMIENPKLIERPIVTNGDKAIVARPSEKIRNIL